MKRVEPPLLSEIGNLDVKGTGQCVAEYGRIEAAADVAETSSLAFGILRHNADLSAGDSQKRCARSGHPIGTESATFKVEFDPARNGFPREV